MLPGGKPVTSDAAPDEVVLRTTPLPAKLQPVAELDCAARYLRPRTHGDFFDAVLLPTRFVFLLMDVAGTHSVASSIAVQVQQAFRARVPELFADIAVNESEAVAQALHDLNVKLMTACRGVHAAPCFIACYNRPLSLLTYINAGGQPALFRDQSGIRLLESGGVPLGLFSHLSYEPGLQAFEPGAALLLVTKGLTETQRGRQDFGIDRLCQFLAASRADSALGLCQDALEAAEQFQATPRSLFGTRLSATPSHDDITAVAMLRREAPQAS